MILTRSYALRLIRAGRARNPVRLRPDERGRVYVAIDVQYARGWTTHHYLEPAA